MKGDLTAFPLNASLCFQRQRRRLWRPSDPDHYALLKTELIQKPGSLRSFEAAEYSALEWADWFNNRYILSPSEKSRQLSPNISFTRPWIQFL